METILETNLNIIKNNNGQIYDLIKDFELPEQYELVQSQSGDVNLLINREGIFYPLHSNYDPKAEAELWCDSIEIDASMDEVFVVLGLGLAYHVEELSRRYPDKKIMVIEPDKNVFCILLRLRNITSLLNNKNIKITVSDNPNSILDNFTDLVGSLPRYSYNFLMCTGYLGKYDELLDAVSKLILKKLKLIEMNYLTSVGYKDIWLTNFFKNLVRIVTKPSCSIFYDKYRNVPAIIVGAGPSIDKNIEDVRRAAGRAAIFSAGSTFQLLDRKGIRPDFVVALDGNEGNEKYFKNINEYNSHFVMSSQFYWGSAEMIKSRLSIMTTASDEYQLWFNDSLGIKEKPLITGPSVSNVCLDLAYRMGMNPIILVGQDMCYTGERLHGEGHSFQNTVKDEVFNLLKDKDIYGNDVYTRESFKAIREYFEVFRERLGPDRTYINCTEGGLNVRGYENMKLSDALERYCGKDISLELKSSDSIYSEACEDLKTSFDYFIPEIEKLFTEIRQSSEEILNISIEAFKSIDGVISQNNIGPEVQMALDRLEKLEKRMMHSRHYKSFFGIGLNETIAALSFKSSNELKSLTDDRERLETAYRAYLSQFGCAYEYADRVIGFIDSFLEKLKDVKD